MKKIILSILSIAFVFAAIGQNLKGYYVEASQKLEAKRAFVIDLDTFYATTQLSGIDTILATKEYVKSVDSEKAAGPASSTDNAIVRFDGTTGKLIQNSGVTISDAGAIVTPSTIQATTAILTNITNGNIPYKSASGFVNSNISQSSGSIDITSTASPTLRLQNNSSLSGTVATRLQLLSYDGSNTTLTGILFAANSAWNYGNIQPNEFAITSYKSAGMSFRAPNSGKISFRAGANPDPGFLTENMQIATSGNILINTGTDNATDKLQVNGSILGTTAKLTNLTDNFLSIHQSDAAGLINSNVFQTSNKLRYNTTLTTFDNDNDIPNVWFVNQIASGNMPKLPVDAATTANITLSGTQTIDGYSAVVGSRILVWKQTTASQNGVYIVASGSWTRATDLDTWAELYKAYVTVLNGAQSGSSFVCTVPSTGTLGTDPITWVLYNAPANILVNSPLSKTGNTISLNYDTNTLDVASGSLKVKDNVYQPLLNGTGFVKASGTTISYDNSTYLTTETDPIFAADSANLLHWSDTLNTTKGIATPYDLSLKQNTLTTGNLTESITGLEFNNTRQVIGGDASLNLTSGYFIPTTTEQSNWNSAYSHSTTITGSIHGSTTVGGNLLRLTNPSAITFLRINSDNTVSALSAYDFRTAIGVGTGTGTVTSVSGTGSVNGITLSGTVTTSGSLTLGGSISGLTTSNLSASAGITNSQLANSSVTVNGNSVSLGGSTTVTANTTNALTLKVNTGTTEGTNLYTFNGSAAKTLDIKSGSNVSFSTAAGSLTINSSDQYVGTVTSVGMTVPTGFSISGSPITSSGTLGITFTPGYSLPTTAIQSNWDAAYGWGNHAVAGYLTQSSFNSGNADLAAIEAISGTTGLLRKTAANTWSLDNSPYLTANQTITLSGAVTGSGTTAITTTLADNAVTSTKLQDNSVTFAKLSDYGTPSSGDFLTYSSIYGFSWTTPNYVPTSRTLTINGTTYDLSANRSWTVTATPAGSNTQVQYNNSGSLGASANFTFNSGTGVVTALNFQLGSDKRLKTDIKKLDNLDWVDKVKFVSFKMKSDTITERYGVIAQDLEKINSNLVNENLLNYKTVSYIDLLIAKVARQDEKIKNLTERIEALEKLLTNKILTK